MRRRRDHVHARVRRKVGVLRSGRVGVHERARAVEVLGVGEQVEHFRRRAGAHGAREDAVDRAALRIRFRPVGERKEIDREENVEELQRVARRLAEAVVETSASRAPDLIEDAVEHRAPLLVFVEALIQKVAQVAPALRHAPRQRARDGRRRILRRPVVLDDADDFRIGRAVDDVVDAAGLEAAVERDGASVGEAPARSRNHLALRDRLVAHGHHVLDGVRVEHRVRLVVAIGERRRVRALVEDEVAAHESGDAPAVVGGDRHLHAHRAGPLGDVPLPSHPEQGEALAHQCTVAEFRVGLRIGRTGRFLKRREHALAAAVADLVEQPAVAARRIDRLEHVEVGARLDLAGSISRRELQVDDHLVARQIRIEPEVDLADELFVRTRGAEGAAVEHDLAALDAQPHDARVRSRSEQHQHQRSGKNLHRAPLTVTLQACPRITTEDAEHAETRA